MRLLLDTHTLFWWLAQRDRLSMTATAAIAHVDNEVFVSLASAWEMAIKAGQGKWPAVLQLLENFEKLMAEEHFRWLPISLPHVRTAGLMDTSHRDPFDRLLAAQARLEDLTLVTTDARLSALGATVLW